MTRPNVLRAEFRVVTPVFCAGANQNGPAEIRPFSLRGALRWWYRALDKDFREREARFFGAAAVESTSSPITLRIRGWVNGDVDYRRDLAPQRATDRGEAYLGYTLYLGKERDRKAVREHTMLTLELVQRRGDDDVRRAWAASLWLFGHLGGLGSRARRGFGTLALQKWEGWRECVELHPAHGARDAAAWKERFDAGFRTIRTWFDAPVGVHHHHLGADVALRIWRTGTRSWQEALHAAGAEFRRFRSDRSNHRPELLAGFGLPLRFRKASDSLVPSKGDRAPSRLQFRVVEIGGLYHPLVWRARGPLLPAGGGMRWQKSKSPVSLDDRLLDAFLDHIAPQCIG